MEELAPLMIQETRRRMDESHERLVKCLCLLGDERVWIRPNAHVVSVGNLVLHLCGNVGQWINATLGGKPDDRQRDREFKATGPMPAQELEERLTATLKEAAQLIESLSQDQLAAQYRVQGFLESGLGILLHVTEHLSYHTGQVTLHTKLQLDMDTGYYGGQDLNARS